RAGRPAWGRPALVERSGWSAQLLDGVVRSASRRRLVEADDARLIGEEEAVAGGSEGRRVGGAAPGVGAARVAERVARLRAAAEDGVDVARSRQAAEGARVLAEAGAVLLVDGRERAERADGRRLVARDPRLEEAGDGDRGDDRNDRDHDHELDQSETGLPLHAFSPYRLRLPGRSGSQR